MSSGIENFEMGRWTGRRSAAGLAPNNDPSSSSNSPSPARDHSPMSEDGDVPTELYQPTTLNSSRRRSSQSTTTRNCRLNSLPSMVALRKAQERERKLSEASQYSKFSISGPNTLDVYGANPNPPPSDYTFIAAGTTYVPSSRNAFANYGQIIGSRDIDPESESNRRLIEEEIKQYGLEEIHEQTYRQLIAWDELQDQSSWKKWWTALSPTETNVKKPDRKALEELVKHYYPPRCSVKAIVYDIYEDHAGPPQEVEIGNILHKFGDKPEDVVLRWIHVPLGLGMPHSSIEDIFCHSGDHGKPFENAARQGIPYLEVDDLHFESKHYVQKMRDIYLLLSNDEELTRELDKTTFMDDNNPVVESYGGKKCSQLEHDLRWRSSFVRWDLSYWNLCQSDVPCMLSERSMNVDKRLSNTGNLGGPVRGLQSIKREYEPQALSKHNFFKDSVLVNSVFRAFHTHDGFLLTMSPARGVDYLDKDFNEYLHKPPKCLHKYEWGSVLAHIMKKFEFEGTRNWYSKTSDWFTVYLMTEIGSQPTVNLGGWTAPPMSTAYEYIVADLKNRRYDPWDRKRNIELIREYNNCMDELNILRTIYARKIKVFSALETDCHRIEEKFEENIVQGSTDAEPAVNRAKWAAKVAQENYDFTNALLTDLTVSLEALFQIRSIEANERSVITDHLNKAVFAFTVVTVIFLPLGFVAAYFGMNLPSILSTQKTQGFFWAICGTIVFIMLLAFSAYFFRAQGPTSMLRRRMQQELGDEEEGLLPPIPRGVSYVNRLS